jgi:hypothetical protein
VEARRVRSSSSALDARGISSGRRRAGRPGCSGGSGSGCRRLGAVISCWQEVSPGGADGCQTVLTPGTPRSPRLCSLRRGRRLALSAALFECGGVIAGAVASIGDVHAGEDRRQLGAVAGEQVDDAARQVGRRDLPRALELRAAAFRATTTVVLPLTITGRARDETFESRQLRRQDSDDGRLGHGEVEVGASDGFCRTEHLRQLVGPAGVPDGRSSPARPRGGPSRHAPGRGARLPHLGEAVEHLAAVARSSARRRHHERP